MLDNILITVNGDQRTVASGVNVAGLLLQFGIEPKMVVVELDGEIIRRDRFGSTVVNSNANVEIVQMMAGG